VWFILAKALRLNRDTVFLWRRTALSMVLVSIVVPVVVTAAVPAMVVVDPAAIAIPVACEELLSIMTRFHPARAVEGWTGPVSVVPLVVVSHGIPVAPDPRIFAARTSWLNPEYTHRRRRADSHSDGNLGEDSSRCQQHQSNQFSLHD
jgi:hypothetical protein